MTGEDGFDVDQGEAEGCLVEDLGAVRGWVYVLGWED